MARLDALFIGDRFSILVKTFIKAHYEDYRFPCKEVGF